MKSQSRSPLLSCLALGLLPLLPSLVAAQDKTVPPGTPVAITVTAGAAPPPPVSITLFERHGHVAPLKGRCTHTGGGLIEVASPAPDTVVITMSGAVLANSQMKFDLEQCFQVNFDDPKVKRAKLSVEGRVIGLLRSHCKGVAEQHQGCASVSSGPNALLSLCVPPHAVAGGENLTVNCHEGPVSVPVAAGKLTLHQTFSLSASSSCCLCKRPSAEFAPDPALEPLWISAHEPFHGINKKDLGFQVTLKVAAEEDKKDGNGKPARTEEKLPPPKP
jgi:hypothetical protein